MMPLAQKVYAAVLNGDFDTALGHCENSGAHESVHAAILQTIEQLDDDWQHDRVGLQDIANAFWTTRRVLEHVRNSRIDSRVELQKRGKALLSVPEGEEHSFGAQLLADRLSRLDWCVDVLFDATNTTVLEQVANQDVDVLGFSIGCDHNLLGLADIITEARIESRNPNLKVIVGGNVFQESLEQYQFLGADAVSGNADAALDQFFNVRQVHMSAKD